MNLKFIETFPATATQSTIPPPHPHPVWPSPCLTTSPPCSHISVLRGVVRHYHLPSTPPLYHLPTPIFPHPHLPPPSLPQSLPQRRHGSNKSLGLCSSMPEQAILVKTSISPWFHQIFIILRTMWWTCTIFQKKMISWHKGSLCCSKYRVSWNSSRVSMGCLLK